MVPRPMSAFVEDRRREAPGLAVAGALAFLCAAAAPAPAGDAVTIYGSQDHEECLVDPAPIPSMTMSGHAVTFVDVPEMGFRSHLDPDCREAAGLLDEDPVPTFLDAFASGPDGFDLSDGTHRPEVAPLGSWSAPGPEDPADHVLDDQAGAAVAPVAGAMSLVGISLPGYPTDLTWRVELRDLDATGNSRPIFLAFEPAPGEPSFLFVRLHALFQKVQLWKHTDVAGDTLLAEEPLGTLAVGDDRWVTITVRGAAVRIEVSADDDATSTELDWNDYVLSPINVAYFASARHVGIWSTAVGRAYGSVQADTFPGLDSLWFLEQSTTSESGRSLIVTGTMANDGSPGLDWALSGMHIGVLDPENPAGATFDYVELEPETGGAGAGVADVCVTVDQAERVQAYSTSPFLFAPTSVYPSSVSPLTTDLPSLDPDLDDTAARTSASWHFWTLPGQFDLDPIFEPLTDPPVHSSGINECDTLPSSDGRTATTQYFHDGNRPATHDWHKRVPGRVRPHRFAPGDARAPELRVAGSSDPAESPRGQGGPRLAAERPSNRGRLRRCHPP